ncbi:helix-turn-helix domain-containing protein [Nocardia sp. NPDC004860]|uniref:PucR family transcriptional regulator n=1 Tax=Nocardia sp. NPDC004860 TaxID=3154557 RepID=UPI0033B8F480
MPQHIDHDWIAEFAAKQQLREDIDHIVTHVKDRVRTELPELPRDVELSRANEASIRAQFREFLVALDRTPFEVRVPPETTDLARTIARRNLDIGIPVKGFRIGQKVFWQYVTRTVDETINDASERPAALVALWEYATEWMDAMLEAGIAAYSHEREQLQRGAIGRRTAAIHAVLRGESVDVDDLSLTLGHPLRQFQTAFVLEADQNAAEPDAIRLLERQAADFAAALGSSRPLTFPSAARGLWAWVATPRPPGDADGLPEPRAGVRVSVGTSIHGVAGFVRSHREAVAAQRVSATGVRGGSLTRYSDVELVCLTTGDGSIDAMRALIARELGPLAVRGDSAARLRETVRVYLADGCNAARAGEELGVHPNTVRYRVRHAEEVLGHLIDERRVHIELALRALHAFGDSLLTEERPTDR